jgi:hypothetical protein
VGEGVIPKMGMMKEERKRRKRGQDLTSLRTKVVKEVSKVVLEQEYSPRQDVRHPYVEYFY